MASTVEGTIRLVRLSANGQIEDFPEVRNDARALHDLLDGYLEPFALPAQLNARNLIGLADEDGQRKELPYNPFSPLLGQTIVGPALIVRSKVPEFVSLTDQDIEVLGDWFGRLLVLPL